MIIMTHFAMIEIENYVGPGDDHELINLRGDLDLKADVVHDDQDT